MRSENLEKLRNLFQSVVLVVLLCLIAWTFGRPQISWHFHNAIGKNPTEYYFAGTNKMGEMYAVGVNTKGQDVLTKSLGINKLTTRTLQDFGISSNFVPYDMHVTEQGDIVLGGKDLNNCAIYFIKKSWDPAVKLISVGTADTYENTFSHITEDSSGYSFLHYEGDRVTQYYYDKQKDELTKGNVYWRNKQVTIPLAVYADGREVFLQDLPIPLATRKYEDQLDVLKLMDVWCIDDEVWILDKTTAELNCITSRGSTGRVETLGKGQFGTIISLTISDIGAVFCTDTGAILMRRSPINLVEISKYLLPNRALSIALIAVTGILILVLIPFLYLLLEWNRSHGQSIVLREGLSAASIIITIILAANVFFIAPTCENSAESWLWSELQDVAARDRQLNNDGIQDNDIPAWMVQSLSGVHIRHYKFDDDTILYNAEPDIYLSIFSDMRADKFIRTIMKANESGSGKGEYKTNGRTRYVYSMRTGEDTVTSVSCSDETVAMVSSVHHFHRVALMIISILAPCLAVLFSFYIVSRRIRRLSSACEAFTEGKLKSIKPDGADELGLLALGIESAFEDKKNLDQRAENLEKHYECFLPSRIMDLLGVNGVEDIQPGLQVEKTLKVMDFVVKFDGSVNGEISADRFDRFYHVIERMSRQVKNFGGYILNYHPDGFVAVFDEDSHSVLQAAIAMKQDIHTGNRSKEDNSDASFFIGINCMKVILGVIGNEDRMQIINIQDSFGGRKSMFDFYDVKNVILCAEDVLDTDSKELSRFVGYLKTEDSIKKIYEVFEGDAYDLCMAKQHSKEQFEYGAHMLMDQQYAEARKSFFEIVRQNLRDDLAIYMMNVADRRVEEK